jgi:hypothetical protein
MPVACVIGGLGRRMRFYQTFEAELLRNCVLYLKPMDNSARASNLPAVPELPLGIGCTYLKAIQRVCSGSDKTRDA